MGDYTTLSGDNSDLETPFTCPEYQYVAADDADYVEQCATDEFAEFLWKNQNTSSDDEIDVIWKGESDLAPSSSAIYLQIYNTTSSGWETLDSDNTTGASIETTLSGSIVSTVEDYYDTGNWVSCRVYQEAK